MNKKEKDKLYKMYLKLEFESKTVGKSKNNYDTGYRVGHINGQVELLEKILDIYGVEKKKEEIKKEQIRIKKERIKKEE